MEEEEARSVRGRATLVGRCSDHFRYIALLTVSQTLKCGSEIVDSGGWWPPYSTQLLSLCPGLSNRVHLAPSRRRFALCTAPLRRTGAHMPWPLLFPLRSWDLTHAPPAIKVILERISREFELGVLPIADALHKCGALRHPRTKKKKVNSWLYIPTSL